MFAPMSTPSTPADDGTTWLGSAGVSSKGQLYLPAPARDHLGLGEGGPVLVFGQRGRVVLTTIELPYDLLEAAAEHAAAAKATRDVSTEGA